MASCALGVYRRKRHPSEYNCAGTLRSLRRLINASIFHDVIFRLWCFRPPYLQRGPIEGIGTLVGLILVACHHLCFVYDQRIGEVCRLNAIGGLNGLRRNKIIERGPNGLFILENCIGFFQKTHYYRLNIFLRGAITLPG